MRQSTTRSAPGDWMDLEREYEAAWYPDKVRIEPDPHTRLDVQRSDTLRQVVAEVRARGRAPRVCRYGLSIGGQWPSNSLAAAESFAVRHAWQVGGEEQIFTDHHGAPAPETRMGWCLVRKAIRAGYADGVVVTTTSVISPHADEYERELRWFELHHAFVAVVAPSARPGRL